MKHHSRHKKCASRLVRANKLKTKGARATSAVVAPKTRRARRKKKSSKTNSALKSSAINEAVKFDRLALIKSRHEAMKREINHIYEDIEPEENG